MKHKKRIIVVLGMHRSGTSVITRALQVMGVDLGDHFIPPRAHDNETGFWEDADLIALNIELFQAVSGDWSTLPPIEKIAFENEKVQGFRDKAVKLLRKKTESVGVFGMKDPRICRLLPFWQDVFKQCELEASYVIAIRHPLSVAKSLEARNSFDEEKVHYLWMNHVIPSILETTGALRVTVNYDRLMDQPVAEIFRVARALYLEDHINPGELAKFEKEFLEEKLRHSRYAVNTFSPGPTIPPGIIEIFALLEKTTSDELSLDDPTVLDSLRRASNRFKEWYPALRYMTRQDERIENLSKKIAFLDEKLSNFARSAAGMDRQIRELGREVGERDRRILKFQENMAGQERRIKELELDAAAWERRSAHFLQQIEEKDYQIRLLREELQSIYASLIWKGVMLSNRFIPLRVREFIIQLFKASKIVLSDAECVNRSGMFNRKWYLSKYPDVAASGLDPIKHYLEWGGFEGRSPSAEFDGEWYLKEYGDVRQKGMNPLVHYIRIGKKEGRKPAPSQDFFESSQGVGLEVVGGDTDPKAFVPSLFKKIQMFFKQIQARFFSWVRWDHKEDYNLNRKRNKVVEIGSSHFGGEAPEVSILIPTYGSSAEVDRCLQSILDYPSRTTYEVLIINDCPAKGAVFRKWVEERQDLLNRFQHKVLSSSRNIGFVSSINVLAKKAKGRWLFFLNDDTEICSSRWLDALIDTLRSDKTIGAVGSLLLFPHSNLVNHAGLYPVARKDGRIWNGCFYKYFNRNYPGVSIKREVPMLTGAALLIARDLFFEIGMLDEAFLGTGGFDDADLSHRLTERGWKLFYVPESVIFHYEGKSSKRVLDHRNQLFINQRYYASKWGSFLKEKHNL